MNELIISLIVSIVSFITLLLTISWSIHISQTKDFTEKYGWGNYRKFKYHFNRCDWDYKYGGERLKAGDCEYGASIIKFKGIGMIMRTPIDWILAEMYVGRYRGKHKRGGYKW